MTVKVDIDGDGVADGIYLSTEGLRRLLEWEAENRKAYTDMVAILDGLYTH